MVGSLLATAALAWGHEVRLPEAARPAALVVLGLGLGQTFSAPVLAAVGNVLHWLILAAFLSIATGLLVARLFVRLAGVDARTGYFCAVPGGIVVMAVLAQRAGVSVAPVTLAQTLRMVVVVLLYPPLLTLAASPVAAGAFQVPRPEVWLPGLALLLAVAVAVALLVRRSGFANPWLFGPCLLTIALAASGALPSGVPVWLVDAAQVAMGAALGQKLTRRFLLSSRRLALASVASVFALALLLCALALALAAVSDLPAAAAVLGMAPGGMPEMAITAKALDLAVPLVLGFHLIRTLSANLLVGPIFRLGRKLRLL
jgi:membrane AbrB-like protein